MKFSIDSREIGFRPGETVADAAARAGIEMPRLCNTGGTHRAGCMVCAVRDKRTGAYLPSCALAASEGMELESSTPEVFEFRKSSLELLLSEHVGDCTAPCRKGCPYGFDIPRFLELLAAKMEAEASEMLSSAPPCEDCKGLCEKVCRRRLVDAPVKIRELVLRYRPDVFLPLEKAPKPSMYEHSLGRPSAADLKAFAETSDDPNGCLRCHCGKDDDCRLRELAGKFGISRVKALDIRRFSRVSVGGIVYESGKCVLCGNCVRGGAFAMRGRAADSRPDRPEGAEWPETLKIVRADICPTGAISVDICSKPQGMA